MVEDPKLKRLAEVDLLRGDYSKAKRVLGWEPKVGFRELIGMMVDADLRRWAQEPPGAAQMGGGTPECISA